MLLNFWILFKISFLFREKKCQAKNKKHNNPVPDCPGGYFSRQGNQKNKKMAKRLTGKIFLYKIYP